MTSLRGFLPFSERNLVLTGAIGPEHPPIGQQVAQKLGMPYVNVEMLIADRMEMPVDEIRAYFGETRLRTIEAEIVRETALRRSSVIRVSGRTLIAGDNLQRLQATGPVFCLTIGLDAMLHRLHVSMGARYHDPNDRALALGELKREWAVNEMDGLQRLDVTEMDHAQVVETLVGLWRSLTVRGQS